MPADELIEEHDVMVPMRDGVRLRADVFRPATGGPHPVLVQRYPYSPRDGFMAMFGRQVAEQGYAVVVQSCRGRYGSEGNFSPFHPDVDDSYDTVEWAAAQTWANGKVGMYGVSYSGMSQWTAAISRPPHLECLVPCLCTWDWTVGGWYQGDGVMTLGLDVLWSAQMTSYEAERRGVDSPLPDFARVAQMMDEGALANMDALAGFFELQLGAAQPLLARRPLRDIEEFVELAPWFRDWCDHRDPRDPYWRAISAKARATEIDLPILHVAGWYDYFLKGGLDAYTTLRREAATQEARDGQRLIVGPWNHNGGQSRPDAGIAGGFFFDFAPGSPTMNFFALHLEAEPAELPSAPVRIYVMGSNEWRDEHEWPLARTMWTPYYLRGHGRLSTDAPADEQSDTFVHDPADLVPGPIAIGPTFNDPVDLDAVASRPDVLAYVTEPFSADMEITGPVTVALWASSSAVSTDFVAKLIEVFADGSTVPICQGVVRTGSGDRPQIPGAIYRYEIDLAATSVVLRAGHRLRLHMASSEYPTYEPNPNTGRRITDDAEMVAATQHIFHDLLHPSHVVLPIVPF